MAWQLGVGHEGFFGPDSGMAKYNPNGDESDWAAKEGQVSKRSGVSYISFKHEQILTIT